MALTRKFLAAMGIEAEKIDEIINAHTETVNALKNERDETKADAAKYKADAERLPEVQKELDDLKANPGDDYKSKYEKEHSDFENYKADVTAKETKAKKTSAYRKMLKDAGIDEKRIDSIIKVSAVDAVELDDDGSIKELDKLTDSVKTEWADFIVKESTHGAETKTPPAGGNGGEEQPSRAAQVAQRHYEAMYGTKGENK